MYEFISLNILNCVSEKPDELLKIYVVIVDHKFLFDWVYALIIKWHNNVTQVVAVGGIYYEFLLLT